MDGRSRLRDGIVSAAIAGVAAATLGLPLTGCLGASRVQLPPPEATGAAGTGDPTPPAGSGTGGIGVTTGAAGSLGGAPVTGGGNVSGGGGDQSGGRNDGGGSAGRMNVACGSAVGGAAGGPVGRGIIFPPNPGPMVSAATPPPAVSGGTLRVLSDGQTVVAADPDRDQIYVVDLATRTVSPPLVLQAGDEPGRVIEDAAGRVHVALRRGGAIVTFDPRQPTATPLRRMVCAAPRGLAYDPSGDLVHIACAGGELVSLPAADGAAVRTLRLDQDLRDVVVSGPRLLVSRFRSAELLTVEADGTMSRRTTLPGFTTPHARRGQKFTAGAAWQMIETPDGGVAVLHQRGVVDPIRPTMGGYGGFNPCDAIVHPAVTSVAPDGTVKSGPALPGLVLAVDMAISPDGSRVAIVSMGNATNQQSSSSTSAPQLTRLYVADMTTVTDGTIGCRPDGTHGPCLAPSSTILDDGTGSGTLTGCPADPKSYGQPIAVGFAGDGGVVVQSREPAMLTFADGNTLLLAPGQSRTDTGHLLFHANAGGFVACASCHLEGNEDGRVWTFDCDATTMFANPRRTQSLQTGLRGSEPFHWNGDEADMTQLMKDVFVTRMSGPPLSADQTNAMLTWIDAQPRPPRSTPSDPGAVARGAALFNDAQNVGCVTCHAGARLSNNLTVDVGTGRAFQVPSLVGIGTRGPFLHDGCAATLRERFNPACGGDRHGATASLSSAQIDDLVAYLGSL